ncbi:hypothetical protein B0H14DRAFT_3449068 [Mycena olivaceomarginata]|nr:hypothetical protein B0H14DRAFT_3449068 [Mycena olivaceomarginata]
MMLEWKRLGLLGPILLANKENAALLRNLLDPAQPKDAVLTEDQFRAFEASTRGGVKTAALAGAIFNNKDDKKGQADRHVDVTTRTLGKQHSRFPDTSNTRFGSHGDAAGELIAYLPQYREIMELIEWSKHNPSLTNIEKNLRDALNDIPTLTELAAMTIYKIIITHPYLRQVRGPGTESTNILDLGPLHHAVRDHIQSILDNPDIIFGSDVAYQSPKEPLRVISKYDNLLAFNVGNEVLTADATNAAPFIKAAARDIKATSIGSSALVGYADIDGTSAPQ